MRAVGLDLGRRRTGVAVSDTAGLVATPHSVIHRGDGGDAAFRAAVAGVVDDVGAEVVVIGLPLSLDGSAGPAAAWAQDEARELAAVLGVPVRFQDERLTTVTATRARAAGRGGERSGPAGARRSRRGKKPVVDSEAAAIMLQCWLDTATKEGVG